MILKVLNTIIKGSNGNATFELSPEQTTVDDLLFLLVEAPNLDTSNVTDMSFMFGGCTALKTIPKLDTSNVTNMYYMFSDCTALETIPELDTSNVTNMYYMFSACTALTTIPELDTSNVTNMSNMFNECSALKTIPKLDTSKVTDISGMFSDCTALETIPELDTSNVTNMGGMFRNCTALENLNLVNWTQSNIDLSYSSKLTPLSVHNIISQAVGTEIRQLTLHADAWQAWVDSEYHDTDVADAATKNIEIIEA